MDTVFYTFDSHHTVFAKKGFSLWEEEKLGLEPG